MTDTTTATAAPALDMTEHRLTVHGVPGRMATRHVRTDRPDLFASQVWQSDRRPIPAGEHGRTHWGPGRVSVSLRFDDSCRNGFASFGMTADVYDSRGQDIGGGAAHDLIAAAFPELAHLEPFHLFDTRGPMHYAANTAYLAGDRDHSGRAAGEPSAWADVVRFGDVPILHTLAPKFAAFLRDVGPGYGVRPFDFEVIRVDHPREPATYGPKFTLGEFGDGVWHACPFDAEGDALRFVEALQRCAPVFERVPTRWSEGKARELDAARRSACWPEATDADLMQPTADLLAALEARRPALLERFRAAMEGVGFAWAPVAS